MMHARSVRGERWTARRDGSAWGNMIFAPMHRPNLHFVEFNWLRSRTCYPKINHYVDGLSHYWTVEPEPAYPLHAWLSSQARPMQNRLVYHPMTISEDDVHTILWHAGVADCCRRQGGDSLRVGVNDSLYRCAATREACEGAST